MIICSCKSFICGDNDIANLSFLSRDTLTAIKELAVHIRHMPQNSGDLCLHGIEERFCVSKLFLGLFHLRRRDQIHGIGDLFCLLNAAHSFFDFFCIRHIFTCLSIFFELFSYLNNLFCQFVIQYFLLFDCLSDLRMFLVKICQHIHLELFDFRIFHIHHQMVRCHT